MHVGPIINQNRMSHCIKIGCDTQKYQSNDDITCAPDFPNFRVLCYIQCIPGEDLFMPTFLVFGNGLGQPDTL